MRALRAAFVVVLAAFFLPSVALSAVLMTVQQDGDNVLFTATGVITQDEIDRLSIYERPSGPISLGGGVSGSGSSLLIGAPYDSATSSDFLLKEYEGLSGPETSFIDPGAGSVDADLGSGTLVGVSTINKFTPPATITTFPVLQIADDYTFGTAINTTMQINDTTLSGLGLIVGNYQWNFLDTDMATLVELRILPIPAALPLLVTALGLLAAAGYRRRTG